MPRYSTTPWGVKPEQRPQFPQNVQPIASAPQATARAIKVFEPNGRWEWAMYHKGQWTGFHPRQRDPFTGQLRPPMMDSNRVIHNPVAWASS